MKKRFERHANLSLHLWSRSKKHPYLLVLVPLAFIAVSCLSSPELTIDTPEGRAAIITEAQNALSSGNCSGAIQVLEDLYDSKYSDNRIRMIYASAHGCVAQIEFFTLIQDIIDNADGFAGLTFWTTVTALFEPATGTTIDTIENRMYSTWLAYDAAMAAIQAGISIPSQYLINGSTYNPGSLVSSNRLNDANFFIFLDSLAVISHTHYRYGDPSSDNEQQTALPWLLGEDLEGSDLEAEAGCAYAGSLIHLTDSIGAVSSSLSNSNVSSALDNISDFLQNGTGPFPGIADSCLYGCQGLDIDGITPVDPACSFTVAECHSCPASDPDCITCPIALRDRTACENSEVARCAAAGIVRFMETTWQDE